MFLLLQEVFIKSVATVKSFETASGKKKEDKVRESRLLFPDRNLELQKQISYSDAPKKEECVSVACGVLSFCTQRATANCVPVRLHAAVTKVQVDSCAVVGAAVVPFESCNRRNCKGERQKRALRVSANFSSMRAGWQGFVDGDWLRFALGRCLH